jgi:hypothetical protein
MDKPKIYLETTMFNFYYAPETTPEADRLADLYLLPGKRFPLASIRTSNSTFHTMILQPQKSGKVSLL